MCKLRAFAGLWDEITAERYGVEDPKLRRFRYGVQVNSLGLTEQQPENNVYRILLETLAVVLSKSRARPRGAAAGLERGAGPAAALGPAVEPAHAADAGLRDRSARARGPVRRLAGDRGQGRGAEGRGQGRARADRGPGRRARRGREGATSSSAWCESNARAPRRDRRRRAEGGRRQLLHRERPLAARGRRRRRFSGASIRAPKREQIERLAGASRRPRRHGGRAQRSRSCAHAAAEGRNIMEPSIACARAGVTTGEWADILRALFGEYRAPTGVGGARAAPLTRARCAAVRARVEQLVRRARAGGPRCWSASPGSTAIPTAPSRSRSQRATAASRWSTTASA